MSMSSGAILNLLAKRAESRQELLFEEIKLHYNESKQRLDAWSIKPSWTKEWATGYEIKVDRQDFIRDDKWQEYLQCCNQFYFVCPKNLIHKEEVPEQAGLIHATEKRLSIVKVAPYMPKTFDPFLLGIIINRMKTNADKQRKERIQEIKEQLEKKVEAKKIGRKLGLVISYEMQELGRRINEQEAINQQLQKVKEFCESMGIDVDSSVSYHSYVKQVQAKFFENLQEVMKQKDEMINELRVLDRQIDTARINFDRGTNQIERIIKRFQSLEATDENHVMG